METLLHYRRFDAKRLKSRTLRKSTLTQLLSLTVDLRLTYTPKRKSKQKSKEHLKSKKDKQKPSKNDQGKTSTTPKKISKQNTMDEPVDKMNKLSIHEPAYAKAYFKAISINPLAEKVYPMSVTKGSNILTTKGRVNNQQSVPINQENTENQTRRRFSYSTCIGCASPDHQTRHCPAIKQLVIDKQLVYNEDYQLCLPNSSRPLYRVGSQTLVEAYMYEQASANSMHREMASNLVTVQSIYTKRGSAYYTMPSITSNESKEKFNYPSDDYSDYEENYSTNDEDEIPIAPVYAAEHTTKDTKQQCRQVMDRVYLPLSRKFEHTADKEAKSIMKPARNEVILTENMCTPRDKVPAIERIGRGPENRRELAPHVTDPKKFNLPRTKENAPRLEG